MNKLKLNGIIFLMIVLLLASLPVFAGDESRIGTAAGVQVQIPVGARNMAMSGADITFTKGVDAIFWNPAGLSNMESRASAQFSTVTIFNDISVNYLAIGAGFGSLGHIGVSIKALDFGDIPVTTIEDMDGTTGETFSPTFSTIGLTYANKLTNSIQVGLTAKMIYESIPRASANAVAFDIGIQYQNLAGLEGVSFGVVAKNIGSNMSYEGSGLLEKVSNEGRTEYLDRNASSDQLPASLELGVAYKYSLMEKNTLMATGTFQNNNIQNDDLRFGLEYVFDNMIMVRGGYVYTTKTDTDDLLYTFTLGAGFHYNLGGTTVGIDYAFRNSQYFDVNNMFGIEIAF
ncbi:MAG: PorV/PorQ family protein [Calditrichaceae bacterium]|nr:PorV/PorQ family protein [Calditrichaceae bacterium]